MNTPTTEQSEARNKQTVPSFFHRHRFYFCGLLAGFGFGLFTVEAFQKQKDPFLYIGTLLLIVVGSTVYRSFRSDQKQ